MQYKFAITSGLSMIAIILMSSISYANTAASLIGTWVTKHPAVGISTEAWEKYDHDLTKAVGKAMDVLRISQYSNGFLALNLKFKSFKSDLTAYDGHRHLSADQSDFLAMMNPFQNNILEWVPLSRTPSHFYQCKIIDAKHLSCWGESSGTTHSFMGKMEFVKASNDHEAKVNWKKLMAGKKAVG